MKKVLTVAFLLTATLWIMAQSEPDFDAIAKNIVHHSLQVQPGEVVILSGTPAELDLLSALYVSVSKAGGQPSIEISVPEANKRAIMETPMEYLGQIPRYFMMQTSVADCYFYAGSTNDPALFADVPEERWAAARKSNMMVQDMLKRAKIRSVSLGQSGGIPTRAYADLKGADHTEMLQMFWNSLDTDYMKMAATGKKLKSMLKPGSELHITSASGTDIHMQIGQNPARINCGRCLENQDPFGPSMAYLPAGEVYTCVEPSTASGKVVVPSTDFRGQKITNLVIHFAEGKIVDVQADNDAGMIRKMLESSSDFASMLSVVDLGINSRSHPLEGADYYSWEMAGMITITTGGNSWAGGDIVSDTGLTLHLAGSDLSVDGEELIRNGKLLSDQLADK